jgi:hypothetical protein
VPCCTKFGHGWGNCVLQRKSRILAVHLRNKNICDSKGYTCGMTVYLGKYVNATADATPTHETASSNKKRGECWTQFKDNRYSSHQLFLDLQNRKRHRTCVVIEKACPQTLD